MHPAPHPLTDIELDGLDEFLAHPAIEETSMDVAVLDGYLTAILLSPRLVVPGAWLARIWDMEDAHKKPKFADASETARILALITRHYHSLAAEIAKDEPAMVPVFLRGA